MARLARAIQGRIRCFPKPLAQYPKFMRKVSIPLVATANILLWIAALVLVVTDPYRPETTWQELAVIPACMIALIVAIAFLNRRSDWASAWDTLLLVASLLAIPFYLLRFV
jgi:hypothetical protein